MIILYMNIVDMFNKVRDIPYRIPLTSTEEDCCCSGKAKQLKQMLEQAGYQTQYRVCEFRWSDIPLPDEVSRISHEDLMTHVYLEVEINGSWIIVDPTWDSGIKSILPVNEWDGKSNTQVAVPVLKTYDPEKSLEVVESENKEVIKADLAKNGEFYKAFNSWLEKVRS